MNRCPNCAAQNREGAKFCTSCGFRLPQDAAPQTGYDRSPFATTSSVPPAEESGGWLPEETPAASLEDAAESVDSAVEIETGPGLSWDSGPPKDTSIPVSDEMIASLVGESTAEEQQDQPIEFADAGDADLDTLAAELEAVSVLEHAAAEQPASSIAESDEETASIDRLLRLARDLEYGLIELADRGSAPVSFATTGLDSRLLESALRDLQSDDDLAPLRDSVATAQERPRDVDVMLDLVLRADAIASLLTERDQLKHAIELALRGDFPEHDRVDEAMPDDADSRSESEPIAL